jgi:GAF domain-containing protein
MTREAVLARTMVALADTLVSDFDLVELLTTLSDRCLEILDVAAAGIMLTDAEGHLQLMTSSSEAMRIVELFELQSEEGPCLDCFRTAQPVVNNDLRALDGRWPRFAPVAAAAGFVAADALPMRLRGQVIGALNLFRTTAGALVTEDLVVAQALADVATIAILQDRAAVEARVLNAQLTTALSSRIAIEQAKGMIAERRGVSVDQAFDRLRKHARHHNVRLSELARQIVAGIVAPGGIGPDSGRSRGAASPPKR